MDYLDYLDYVKIIEAKTTRKKIQAEIANCTDERLLKELELKAKYIGINEYFPTPYCVCEFIGEHCPLPYHPREGYKILEPSAGTGSFAENLLNIFGFWEKEMFDVIELNPDFQEHLKWKGFNLIGDNCLDCDTYGKYDLLVMNPPFKYARQHLEHCIKLLKPGSLFVCIVPTLFMHNNQDLEEKYSLGEYKIPDNAFQSSCTNVRVSILDGYAPYPNKNVQMNLWEV